MLCRARCRSHLVAVLGASGAARAAGLEHYGLCILAAALPLLASGFWTVYRRRQVCVQGVCGASPLAARVVLWVALALWLVSVAINVAAHVLP